MVSSVFLVAFLSALILVTCMTQEKPNPGLFQRALGCLD